MATVPDIAIHCGGCAGFAAEYVGVNDSEEPDIMEPFPHHYKITVDAAPERSLDAYGEGLPHLTVDPPVQFGGSGEQWSPETLLMAAVANCFVLSFRAIAKASGLEWHSIECSAEGTLDKVDRKIRFTEVTTQVRLVIPSSQRADTANRLLQKAHDTCLVSNSLVCDSHLACEVEVFDR